MRPPLPSFLVSSSKLDLPLKGEVTNPSAGAFWNRSGAPDRLPLRQALGDERGALLVVAAVEDARIVRVGAPVDARGARVELRIAVGAGGEVAGGAVGGVQPDLAGSVELRRVRVERPLAPPAVEDAGPAVLLLRRLAPVTRRQAAVLAPRAAGERQPAAPARARFSGGSAPTAPSRCARSARTATKNPRCARGGPRSRSPCGFSG